MRVRLTTPQLRRAVFGALLRALCLCGAAASAVQAQPPVPPTARTSVDSLIRDIVRAKVHAMQRWPRLDDVVADLQTLYDSSGWTPLWSRDGQATPSARAVVQQLSTIDARGLVAADFDATLLQGVIGTGTSATLSTPTQRAAFDLVLSTGALRAVRALRFGRVSTKSAHAALDFPAEPFDAVQSVRLMSTSTNPSLQFDEAEPTYLHYHLLKGALARFRVLARDTTLLPLGVVGTVKPHDTRAGIPKLRRLLRAFGDLPQSATPVGDDSLRYDSLLVVAVRKFQTRHALTADGVIGATTLAQLRTPFAKRVAQMELTLERWRWLPHVIDQPPVIVNVPAFRLYAFSTGSDKEADLLSMDVVVGDAFDHQTPMFSGRMQYLVFAPYWEVPASIARDEILPKARADIAYLERLRYDIVRGADRVVPPSVEALETVASGKARFRQQPGPNNSLGRVKFIFPNTFDVYLHDTPARAMFGRARRDGSHGCIRVADAARLATFLLRNQPGWDSLHVRQAMSQTTPQRLNLTTAVPVHIVYATVVAREDGTVLFYDDIYALDRSLRERLTKGFPYAMPRP